MRSATEQVTEQKERAEHWKQKESNLNHVYLFFLVIGVGISLVYALQEFYPPFIGPISNIVPSILATAGLVVALQNSRRYGFHLWESNFDRIWFCFSLGSACWILAEASWAVYYFAGVSVPYPGVPDIFYLAAYVPMSLAVLFYFRSFAAALTPYRRAASIGAIAMSVALVMGVVLPFEFSHPRSGLTVVTDLAYPAGDLILLSLTILSLAIFLGGSMGKWWTFLAVAIILDIVGDELFLYQVAAGTYYNGNIDDLIYVWAYLLFPLAYSLHKKEL